MRFFLLDVVGVCGRGLLFRGPMVQVLADVMSFDFFFDFCAMVSFSSPGEEGEDLPLFQAAVAGPCPPFP